MAKDKIQLSEITFKKLYNQIIYKLKRVYNKANSSFTLASPFGHILSTLTDLFGMNMLYTNHVRRQFDLNDSLNQDVRTVRSFAKLGQYNPNRGTSATGVIKLKLKAGVDINTDIPGGKVIFSNKQKLKNDRNNLEYMVESVQDELVFSVSNTIPILLNIIQGTWKEKKFTGTGESNQSYTINVSDSKELDNFKFKVYVNDQLMTIKKHKFDMLFNEKACVALTSFSGGLDIIFGNGDEGYIPPFNSIIRVEYLLTEGKEGNIINPVLNEFKFIDMPKDFYGEDIDVQSLFDIDTETNITFGTDGDNPEFLKKILPYTSSNFVLAGTEQYKFFLKRIGLFSIIDAYSTRRNDTDLIKNIYNLAKANTDLLNKTTTNPYNSTLRQLISQNLKHITDIKKLLLTEGGDNVVNLFLIPDIRIFYGSAKDTNYYNISLDAFTLDADEKARVLNYLSSEGIQTILNEVKIQDPVIKRYALNATLRLYDDAVIDNINNQIISATSDYFIDNNRRDRIPSSDLVRILDGIDGIDSVVVDFVSELNENYHKEFLMKSEQFKKYNGRYPNENEIIMSDGKKYDSTNSIGIDIILGDIVIDKNDLCIIRGGFTDRYNNYYNSQPGQGTYSSVNIIVLPERTKRKQLS